jgi:putative nucleotidyltransferase with HDIG domain
MMRAFLSVVLVLVTFLSCYVETFLLLLVPPQPQQVARFTVRSQRVFAFDQEKVLGNKRQIAISQYIPLYVHVPDSTRGTKKRMEDLIRKVSALQALLPRSQESELTSYLHEALGVKIEPGTAGRLLRYRNLTNLLTGILTIEELITQGNIVNDPAPLKGRKTIDVLYPRPGGIVPLSTEDVITVQEARLALEEKVKQLFWQVDKRVLEPVLQISAATLLPTLKYDEKENATRIEEIIRSYPSKLIVYKPGDVLVPYHKLMSEQDALLVAAYQGEEKKDLYDSIPWVLLSLTLLVVLYNLWLSKILRQAWSRKAYYRPLLWLLIFSVLVFKLLLLCTPYPIYMIPFASLPLLAALLMDKRSLAALATLMGAMLTTMVCGPTLEHFLFFTFGGMAAVLASLDIRKRVHLVFPSLIVAITNVIVLVGFSLNWGALYEFLGIWQKAQVSSLGSIFQGGLLPSATWASIGGLAAGPITLLLLPLLEMSWDATSNFKLNRYTDLQHPVLKDLLNKAPATYQHTMNVAFLAESVGEAVGANPVLLRVGAYFHDIGKMASPQYFTENQASGENPHDKMNPQKSAQVIMQHVEYGQKLGRDMKLPEVVLDMILQHHGTLRAEYFYNKAQNAHQGKKPREEDFRYPGPKPQTIEAAILMIVDAVEATARSMQDVSKEKIDQMILFTIVERLSAGQFEECNLSTRDISKIIKTLSKSLEATFHSRVPYPWQQKESAAGSQ